MTWRPLLRGVAAACLALPLLAGCLGNRDEEPGVVATVNGAPIRLVDLEARHDLGRLGVPQLDNPAVERLRTEYGAVLADMIVARLVQQELDRLGLAASPEELAAAEGQVRADYPGEAFEAMLLEEHIDPVRWREMLADRLALEKFSREVLRQNIRVGVSEAANYYKEHIDAFAQPARVRLALVQGRDAEAVKAALAVWRKSGQLSSLDGLEGVNVREAGLPEKNLPASWREAVKGLKPGEASAPRASGREQLSLILLERTPETVLDPAKAYARVEAVLAAEKLEKAFAAWLAQALAEARITVTSRLLRPVDEAAGGGDASEKPSQAQAEIASAKSETEARDYLTGQARKTLADREAEQPGPAAPSPAEDGAAGRDGVAVAAPGTDAAASAAVPDAQSPAPVQPVLADRPPPAVAEEMPAETPAASMPVAAVAAAPAGDGGGKAPVPAAGQDKAGAAGEVQAATPASGSVVPEQPSPAPAKAGASPAGEAGEVEFAAVKASWILFTVDEGTEERVYLKPGKALHIAFKRRLSVRLGSPSEVTYRHGGREHTVEVGKKENKVLEFP